MLVRTMPSSGKTKWVRYAVVRKQRVIEMAKSSSSACSREMRIDDPLTWRCTVDEA
jgi:hypothetical protein